MARRTGLNRSGGLGVDLYFAESSRTFLSPQPVAHTFKPAARYSKKAEGRLRALTALQRRGWTPPSFLCSDRFLFYANADSNRTSNRLHARSA